MGSMGRNAGRGRLERRVLRNGQLVFVGHWTDSSGNRRKRVLGTRRADAEKLLNAEIHRRDLQAAGLGALTGQEIPLADLLEPRREHLQALDRTAGTIKRELEGARRFALECGAERVRDLSVALVTSYQARRKAAGVSNRTINMEVTAFSRCLKLALQQGRIAANPLLGAPSLPTSERHLKRVRRALEPQEAQAVLEALDRRDEELGGCPQAPFFRIALLTGCRLGELLKACWADFDREAQVLHLSAERKNGRSHLGFLGPEGVRVLDDLLERQAQLLDLLPSLKAPIFFGRKMLGPANATVLRKRLREALEAAGVPAVDHQGRRLDIHALRTTYGTRLAEAGVSLGDLQQLMGHSSPTVTARYYTKPKVLRIAHRLAEEGILGSIPAPIRHPEVAPVEPGNNLERS